MASRLMLEERWDGFFAQRGFESIRAKKVRGSDRTDRHFLNLGSGEAFPALGASEELYVAVRAANGLTVVTDYAAGDPLMPPLDVLVVPGSQGIRDIPNSQGVAEWLAELCKSATWVTSVCTGVFLLHQAGYTKGKRVATHFWAEDELESLGDVTVVRDQRWVVDGNLVTSQGVSAGIDLSLWLVGQLHSPAHALKTQKVMQYHPDPPYQAGGEQEAEHSA